MKTKWPVCRLTCQALVSAAILASPAGAGPGVTPGLVRVDAQVTARTARIDAKASGPFTYTASRPSENLLVVDLAGVASAEPSTARVLSSDVVSSYRVLPLGALGSVGVRLEILLRKPVEPRWERRGPDQLTLVFEEYSGAVPTREVSPTAPALPRPPAPVTTVGAPAAVIGKVEIGRVGPQVTVRVEGSGRLNYQESRLDHPERVVLDFPGAQLALDRTASIPSGLKPVERVRLGQFKPDVPRLVIELERKVPYRVNAEGKTVTVAFAASTASSPIPDAIQKPAALVKKAANAPHREIYRPGALHSAAAEISGMPLPATLTRRLAVLATPAAQKQAGATFPAVRARPEAQQPVPAVPAQAPAEPPQAAEQQGAPGAPQAAGKYSGEPISVNLKDVDLKDFFRLIHEISGLNVVLDPAVKGTVTLVLDDVPWDQALDIVLRNNNMDKQLEGNVLRIATQDTIKREAETKRDLLKAQAEAVEQVTSTRVLSYAKATAMRETLRRFLSPRGEILADERSNTLIIRDIPTVMPQVDNLIRQLDRKGQQVEIEARVVSATRSFARDIGTQFGFATTATRGRTLFGGLVGAPGFTSPISSGTGIPPPPLVTSGTTSLPFNSNLPAGAPTSGISFAHRSPNFAVDFIISAAEAKGVGKLLSKPKVITQNNEKATVKQGTKIPVQTTINNTISVQFIDAVLKLEVTPQITAEGTISMIVLVENTAINAGIPRVQGIPALDTQSVEAHVVINDGGTVVIGGVIVSSQRTDISEVPLFGSIPLIGHLFKRTNVNVTSQELLFFLTPRIVPS